MMLLMTSTPYVMISKYNYTGTVLPRGATSKVRWGWGLGVVSWCQIGVRAGAAVTLPVESLHSEKYCINLEISPKRKMSLKFKIQFIFNQSNTLV